MAVRILFDKNHNVIQPTFVLANRNGKKLGSIPAENINIADNFNSYFELSMTVNKYNNGSEFRLWKQLTDFKLLWCREWDVWFEISVELSEETSTKKNIQAYSVGEAELSQIKLYNIEINTEDDISRDDYEVTVLFDKDNPNASLLNRITEKAPHYKINHVDASIAKLQRIFSFDNISIYDAFQEIAEEIDCIFIINSGTNSEGKIAREINVYDLESYCMDCGTRGDFYDKCSNCASENISNGYGKDTSIFVSTENLADDITYSTDVNSVKNCFKLVAGDDLMTATIRNSNPNGSDYIWYISDELKSDMSESLVKQIDLYNDTYKYYQDDHKINFSGSILADYNELVKKYQQYSSTLELIPESIIGYPNLMTTYYNTIDLYLFLHDGLMPSIDTAKTTAILEAAKLTKNALSPVTVQNISACSSSTASSYVLAIAKTIISPLYQVKVNNGILNGSVWTGSFVITNYSDETDTAISASIQVEINDDLENYVKQKLTKTLSDKSEEVTDIVSLFSLSLDNFKDELKKYCLTRLESFRDGCQSCLDILIEQGISTKENWINEDKDLYSSLYEPYYQKLLAVNYEIQLRESELNLITGTLDDDGNVITYGLQTLIEEEKANIQNILNFENFLGTDLWLEFIAYRREDTYSNDNYISDGLNNRDLFDNAQEFIKTAQKEIYKSATLQHSISATLKNLLVMEAFYPLVDYFEVGNWIRVMVDKEVYRLRLISYQIDFDNLDNLSITFSDVKSSADGITDSQSIFEQISSITGSYNSVTRQANQGKKSYEQLESWVNESLALTNMKIVNDDNDESIIWDSHGLLFRSYNNVTDTFSPEQLRVLHSSLIITDNDWLTTKTAIGKICYKDPVTGKIIDDKYGINGEVVVGKLLIGEGLGIYNESGSLTFNENGFAVTNGINTVAINPNDGHSIFSISNTDDGNVFFVNDDGDLVIVGNITAKSLTLINDATIDGNNISGLADVAISGDYNDLKNIPKFATIATTGKYSDLIDVPTFSTVASTGNYNDLKNIPTFSAVAFSGKYSDLIDAPTDIWGEIDIDNLFVKPKNDDTASIGQYLIKQEVGSLWVNAETTISEDGKLPVCGKAVYDYSVNKNQGTENAEKLLYVNSDGYVTAISIDKLKELLEITPLSESDIDSMLEESEV